MTKYNVNFEDKIKEEKESYQNKKTNYENTFTSEFNEIKSNLEKKRIKNLQDFNNEIKQEEESFKNQCLSIF